VSHVPLLMPISLSFLIHEYLQKAHDFAICAEYAIIFALHIRSRETLLGNKTITENIKVCREIILQNLQEYEEQQQ